MSLCLCRLGERVGCVAALGRGIVVEMVCRRGWKEWVGEVERLETGSRMYVGCEAERQVFRETRFTFVG